MNLQNEMPVTSNFVSGKALKTVRSNLPKRTC